MTGKSGFNSIFSVSCRYKLAFDGCYLICFAIKNSQSLCTHCNNFNRNTLNKGNSLSIFNNLTGSLNSQSRIGKGNHDHTICRFIAILSRYRYKSIFLDINCSCIAFDCRNFIIYTNFKRGGINC